MSHRHASGPSRRRFLGVELVDEPSQRPDPTAPEREVLEAPPTDPSGRGGGDGDGDGTDDGSGPDEPKPKKPLWRRIVKWTSIGVVMMIIAGIGTFLIAYAMIDIPDPNQDFETETTEVYYADGKHLLGTFAIQNRQEVGLAEVPEHVQNAVISAEDRTFWENAGIDIRGIIRAAWSNARSDTTQGASTITQQYVKVLYLSQERTWSRKLKEAILSLKVQRKLTKEQVLQGYLNTIYFGRGAYGIQAAAEAYFEKDAEDLEVDEGAALAAILNSPTAYDPANGKEARRMLLGRYQYVLDGMVEMDVLDEDKAEKLRKRLPKFPRIKRTNVLGAQKGHLMNMVEQELLAEGFSEEEIYGGGLRVTTTFRYGMQKKAQRAVAEQKKAIKEYGGKFKQLHIALASVQPGTGAVRAIYGGHNYLSEVKNQGYNWALKGAQPGSSFKAFAVLAALRQDISLYDTFDGNAPFVTESGEEVGNQGDAEGASYGPVTLLEAVEHSVNTAFVDLTEQMENGPNKIIKAAIDAGIPKKVLDEWGQPYPAVTSLGYDNVPTIDMANAYATFAAEGERADWYTVEKVTDASGESLYSHPDRTERAFSKKIAADVNYALNQVIDSSEGTGNNAAIDCPAAGKTGTATGPKGEVSSSWFVGYTPKLSTAVMYVRGDGNNQLEGYLPSFYGGDYPARTWQSFMSAALDGKPCEEFAEPEDEYTQPEQTEPTETEPTETEPTETEPTESEPTESEPTESEPTQTQPTQTEPTETEPTETQPTQPTDPTCTPPFCDGPGGPGGPDGGADAESREP